ncbi:MAG: type IV toxin-antitoxin system AbiEi family antitoxin domain-containing protein [Gammaproteobacteria bacterium]
MPKVLTALPAVVAALIAAGHGLFTAEAAGAEGIDKDRLGRLVHAGLLTRVAHGCYAAAAEYQRLRPWDRHRIEARALSHVRPGAFVTGWSAAAIWRLRTMAKPPARPSALWPKAPGRGSTTTPRGRLLVADLPPEHRWRVGDAKVVSKAWAVVDVGRTAPAAHSLVVADAALRMGADLSGVLSHMYRWPGMERARWVVDHADPGAESALETLGRFCCIEARLPMPVSNAWVGHDRPVYRVDGLWPWHWVAHEADGAVKYDDRPDASRIVAAQNEREWYLRRLGLDVVRYGWTLATGGRGELAARFAALLRDNPARDEPIRWWKNVAGVGPVVPEPDDWPSPWPPRAGLPSWWVAG